MNYDIIFGLHSIAEAINNPKRENLRIYCTDESFRDLKKMHFKGQFPDHVKVKLLSSHSVQEESKVCLKELGFKEQRVPSNAFMLSDPLEQIGMVELYKDIEANKELRILALDQVTDVHNVAAIARSAVFNGIDYLVVARKGGMSFPPSYFRISSGAHEHIKIVFTANLSKSLKKWQDLGLECLGLAEEATVDEGHKLTKGCLVMGAEDSGLSHATRRSLENFVALRARGAIKSLNVSVAAALAMEKFF